MHKGLSVVESEGFKTNPSQSQPTSNMDIDLSRATNARQHAKHRWVVVGLFPKHTVDLKMNVTFTGATASQCNVY